MTTASEGFGINPVSMEDGTLKSIFDQISHRPVVFHDEGKLCGTVAFPADGFQYFQDQDGAETGFAKGGFKPKRQCD